jgi:ergothioneine biosynthesis glutamate--cysteine ligase EgtA
VDQATPPPGAVLTEADAEAHVQGVCFKTGPPGRVGVELEWLVRDRHDPAALVAGERVTTALAGLARRDATTADGELDPGEAVQAVLRNGLSSGARITLEPGGQLELSSPPAENLGELVTITQADLAIFRDAAADAGLELCGYGLDPLRLPPRLLNEPRYAAMEKFFGRGGQQWGRQMMCGTASVQVCVDAGDDSGRQSGFRSRWELLDRIGPILVSAFANSPLRNGQPTGWRSTRQQVWSHLDPSRTRAPELNGDPRAAWAAYALDAEVMCIRDPDPAKWTAPAGLTFRAWLREAPAFRRPTTEDLDFHLSTLFPPVRPHGHLELRMIDAQTGDGWIVPAAVVNALVEDPVAAGAAMDAAAPIWAEPATADRDPWLRAARDGPADPEMSRASRRCFEAAWDALERRGAPAVVTKAVADFIARYVQQDRCPADDQLEGSSLCQTYGSGSQLS